MLHRLIKNLCLMIL